MGSPWKILESLFPSKGLKPQKYCFFIEDPLRGSTAAPRFCSSGVLRFRRSLKGLRHSVSRFWLQWVRLCSWLCFRLNSRPWQALGVLEATWAVSLDFLEATWWCLRASWEHLGVVLASFGRLGSQNPAQELYWRRLGPSWWRLGGGLGASWAVLERLGRQVGAK